MTMNGIDIANYQSSLNAGTINADFVIIKATQGTSYVNRSCDKHFQQALKAGKALGVYHYISGAGATAEADFFVKNIKGYIGKAMLCLDWESQQNKAWGNETYLERVAKAVIERTGIKPMIYVQASRLSAVRPVANRLNCGLWVAQYGSTKATGYQAHPWNEGKYTCAIRQYTSNGRLSGYSGALDLDIFYGDRTAWNKYAGVTSSTPKAASATPKTAPAKKSVSEIADEVLAGKWGNGVTRKAKLKAAGYDYNAVQAAVNAKASKENAAVYYIVRRGDTLSAIAKKYGTTVATIQKLNGIKDANKIHVGQKIRVK